MPTPFPASEPARPYNILCDDNGVRDISRIAMILAGDLSPIEVALMQQAYHNTLDQDAEGADVLTNLRLLERDASGRTYRLTPLGREVMRLIAQNDTPHAAMPQRRAG